MVVPSLLTFTNNEIPLYLHVSATDTTISSILLQEEDEREKLIYFISKVLNIA